MEVDHSILSTSVAARLSVQAKPRERVITREHVRVSGRANILVKIFQHDFDAGTNISGTTHVPMRELVPGRTEFAGAGDR